MKNDQGAAQSTPELLPDKDCQILDALDFQVGAVARVTGAYAGDWPEHVRILGIEKYRTGALNITIGGLDGSCPTDGFGINEINPQPRHRIEHTTPDHNAAEEVRDMLAAYSKVQGVLGPQDREGLLLAIRALTSTPDTTDHAGVSEKAESRLISDAMVAALTAPNALHRVSDGMRKWLSPGVAFSHEGSSYIFAGADEEATTDGNGNSYRIVYGWSPQQLRTALLAALRTPPVLEVAKEALEQILHCTPANTNFYDCGDPFEIARAALKAIGAGQ